MEKVLKVDMHMHTKYSPDCMLSLKSLRKICVKKGILPCITDHSTMKGALKYHKKYKESILAEEVKSSRGEIIGYFMNEPIKKGLDPFEVVDKLKEQGALIGVPHPFDTLRNSRLDFSVLKQIKPDILEVYNGRILLDTAIKRAKGWAERHGYVKSAGSDSHFGFEAGRSYAVMEDFDQDNPKAFLASLKKARLIHHKSGIWPHGLTKIVKKLKILGL